MIIILGATGFIGSNFINQLIIKEKKFYTLSRNFAEELKYINIKKKSVVNIFNFTYINSSEISNIHFLNNIITYCSNKTVNINLFHISSLGSLILKDKIDKNIVKLMSYEKDKYELDKFLTTNKVIKNLYIFYPYFVTGGGVWKDISKLSGYKKFNSFLLTTTINDLVALIYQNFNNLMCFNSKENSRQIVIPFDSKIITSMKNKIFLSNSNKFFLFLIRRFDAFKLTRLFIKVLFKIFNKKYFFYKSVLINIQILNNFKANRKW